MSDCAPLTACVSHVWKSYPGDTPTASVIITIIRMRMNAAERFLIMVSRILAACLYKLKLSAAFIRPRLVNSFFQPLIEFFPDKHDPAANRDVR